MNLGYLGIFGSNYWTSILLVKVPYVCPYWYTIEQQLSLQANVAQSKYIDGFTLDTQTYYCLYKKVF